MLPKIQKEYQTALEDISQRRFRIYKKSRLSKHKNKLKQHA